MFICFRIENKNAICIRHVIHSTPQCQQQPPHRDNKFNVYWHIYIWRKKGNTTKEKSNNVT